MTASIRKLLVAGSTAALTATALAPAADAAVSAATAAPAVVQLAARPAPIRSDGTVAVVMWVRCRAGLQAFEIDTVVRQRNAEGSSLLLADGAPLVACDGTRQRTVVRVAPDPGDRFHSGVADIGVYVGFYDPSVGSDLEATDQVTVRLTARPG